MSDLIMQKRHYAIMIVDSVDLNNVPLIKYRGYENFSDFETEVKLLVESGRSFFAADVNPFAIEKKITLVLKE